MKSPSRKIPDFSGPDSKHENLPFSTSLPASSRFKGSRGEVLASQFLQGQNYRILEYNWRSGRSGEMDLIAEDPAGVLVFIEVKRDSKGFSGMPEEWVHLRKQRQLGRLALRYCGLKQWTERDMRFDVIAITELDGQEPRIRHFTNAFLPPRESWF